jgi:hypothetical protein
MITYLLHGVTDGDPKELVAQFFQYPGEVVEFVREVPGTYRLMHLQSGVDMDLLRVTYDLPI